MIEGSLSQNGSLVLFMLQAVGGEWVTPGGGPTRRAQ